jgi:hypothetical protein
MTPRNIGQIVCFKMGPLTPNLKQDLSKIQAVFVFSHAFITLFSLKKKELKNIETWSEIGQTGATLGGLWSLSQKSNTSYFCIM